MSYIHFDNEGNRYEIKYISPNYSQVIKNGLLEMPCDTYEEAQHYIDDIVF